MGIHDVFVSKLACDCTQLRFILGLPFWIPRITRTDLTQTAAEHSSYCPINGAGVEQLCHESETELDRGCLQRVPGADSLGPLNSTSRLRQKVHF
jgi:hypothetical protein